ncbi:MAG: hypothetical protein AB7O86_12205 [Porticoccaceae bacterium]
MIPIEEAKAKGFQESTKEELRAYFDEIGKKWAPAAKSDSLARTLRAEFGIAENTFEVTKVKVYKAKGGIVPPYNLEQTGKWGGRRHRIRVRKPEGTPEKEKGFFIWANGSYCGHPTGYPIVFGEVQNVPEPVYLRLQEIDSVSFRAEKIGDDVITEFDTTERKYMVDYLGPDNETKGLAGSLQEWYRMQGVKWIQDRKDSEIHSIADRLDVSRIIRNSHTGNVTEVSADEVRRRVMIFLWGEAEVEEAA